MRVILDGPAFGPQPAGPGVHLRSLARAMLSADDSLELVLRHLSLRSWGAARNSRQLLGPRLRVRALPIPNSAVRRLQRATGMPSERTLLGRYDIYHQLHTDADPAVPDDRLVVTLHDTVALRWPEEEGAMAPTARRLLERCAAVITVSQYSKGEICSAFGLPDERVHVIPNGVDVARFSPDTAAAAMASARSWLGIDRPYLLYVGGGTPRKNVDGLLKAFDIVRREAGAEGLHLALVGPVGRREQELRAVFGEQGQAQLHFPGFVPEALLPGLYGGARAVVSPSHYEGFGMPALEALACGAPLVASATSALPEVAGGVAELVDPRDPLSIADGILRVLARSTTEAAAQRAAGVERARGYSWALAAEGTRRLYSAIADPCAS